MSKKGEGEKKSITIPAPNFKVAIFKIVGTAPYVMHKFSNRVIDQLIETQKAGTVAQIGRAHV